jgi:hypothetical protein
MTHLGRPKGTDTSVASARAAYRADACPRCGLAANITGKDYVCGKCKGVLTKEAQVWQECAYLANYLSTRADDDTPQVKRLRMFARDQGVDWHHPPAPMAFADRMAVLMTPYRPQLDVFPAEEAS